MNVEPTQTLQLRDIHMPLEPLAWPPAPGWWLLAALLLVGLVLLLSWALRRWRHVRLRSRVMNELQQLSVTPADATLIVRVSTLLKQVALARYPRSEVAALSGEAWLAFLDRTGGDGRFTQGPGRVLASGPYAPPDAIDGELDNEQLIALGRSWIRRNL